MKRDFTPWLNTMINSIADWTYYTDFPKCYDHADKIKIELNILSSLIGSQKIEDDFKRLAERYPETLSALPILIAKREKENIIVKGTDKDYSFNFKNPNYSLDEYVMFLRRSGVFDLLEKHLVANLYDYVLGVEVGLDSNSRKNRTGETMEKLVENFLIDAGLEKNKSYFCQMKASDVKPRFGIDLSGIDKANTAKKAEKRFDFVIYKKRHLYLCEVNFYSSQGSKLNETARSYKEIALELKERNDVSFLWVTDGQGWFAARNNLRETFEVLDDIYNLNDLRNGLLKRVFNP